MKLEDVTALLENQELGTRRRTNTPMRMKVRAENTTGHVLRLGTPQSRLPQTAAAAQDEMPSVSLGRTPETETDPNEVGERHDQWSIEIHGCALEHIVGACRSCNCWFQMIQTRPVPARV